MTLQISTRMQTQKCQKTHYTQCAEKILNVIAEAISKTFTELKGMFLSFRSPEHALYEILDLRA